MERLYKLWNNRGECLLKYATKAECVECITMELETHPSDCFELEFQCTQDELDANCRVRTSGNTATALA